MKQWPEKLAGISRIKRAFSYGLVLTFGTGIVCSLIAFAIVWDLEKKKIAQEFEQDGAEIAASIERSIEKNLQNLESIVGLYNASENVTRQEFQQFTKNYLATNPEIQALEWIPRVVDEAREAYEQAARLEELTQFEITEQDDRQQLIRAKSRPEYFPVYFVEPYQGNEAALGFDLASNPTRLQALQLARDTGQAIATDPITLVQKSNLPKQGFLVFSPIYRKNEPTDSVAAHRQNLAGFALGVFMIADLVEGALDYLQAKEIDVVLVNESAPPEDRLFYTSNSSLTLEAIEAKSSHQRLYHHHQLNVAEQQWLIVTQPRSEYILQRANWQPWGVLGSGMLITLILCCYIRERIAVEETLRTKELQLEERVQQRTRELQEAEGKYRHIFDNVAEGIFICTLDSQYINVNPALASIYGYDSPQQLMSERDKIEKGLFVNLKDWQKLTAALDLQGAVTNFECQVYRADGSKIWISTNIHRFGEGQKPTNYYEGTVIDITFRKQAEDSLRQSNNLLRGITLAQSRLIEDAEPTILFDGLLENLLQITDSEYGFIGEVFYTEGGEPYVEEAYMKMRGQPYLKTHAITNIAWNEETRQFYAENAPQGMEFHNLNTLFGAVIVTGKPVIANNPSTDPRRGGLPPGHPPLNAFLGLPFYSREGFLGMVGIANRPNGYDRALVDYLEPFLATCSNIIEASRSEKKRQQAEVALKESEESYRSIVETANEGIWLLDANGNTNFVNPRVGQMLGYQPEQLLGQSIFTFIEPKNRKIMAKKLANLLEAKQDCYDCQFCHQDGSAVWVLVSASPMFTLKAQYIGILLMMTDISDRKRAEIELAAAKYRAEAASQAKSQFIASMSHELRTPLNGILGSVKLLQRDLAQVNITTLRDFSHFQKNLTTIENSGRHLLGIIDDILDFSQIERRQLILAPAPIYLPTFFSEIFTIVRVKAAKKGLQFKSELLGDLPSGIEADRQRLKQTLLNLLDNAVKFTDCGQVTFRVSTSTHSKAINSSRNNSLKLRFEVIDTGIGIAPEKLNQIFQAFEQANPTESWLEGTGLGLAISQQLIELMGSKLQVTSQLGSGTTFWFEVSFPIPRIDRGTPIPHQAPNTTINKSDDKIKASKLIVPPPQQLEDLYELAMLGSMKKIREWAISLEKLDQKYQPFASQLQELAQSFQEKAILNLVEQYISQE